jgi:uncharacterized membrane protein
MAVENEINTGPAPARIGTLVRRAFDEFMALPALILLGFILLAAVTLVLDAADLPGVRAGHEELKKYLFRTEQGTAALLGTILSGLLTVISITFSVLLLAVQQTAGTLTNQVYDQFLRRRINQAYFGYSVGLAVYTLLVLATVGRGFNPAYSAACVVLLTVLGLGLLVLLIYGTIDQMRPAVIIQSMHDHILAARGRQRGLLRRTRREPGPDRPGRAEVRAQADGFLEELDLDRLAAALKGAGDVEVEVPIGSYRARGDVLAVVRARSRVVAEDLAPVLREALRLAAERNLAADPSWGVAELGAIAWNTTSSAKSSPEPPRLVIDSLRDLITRWADEESDDRPDADVLPVVYRDDLFDRVFDTLATIAAGAKESLQHVVMAEALGAFRALIDRLPARLRGRVVDVVRRVVPALRPLVLTHRLEVALDELAADLRRHGEDRAGLAKRIGRVAPRRGG